MMTNEISQMLRLEIFVSGEGNFRLFIFLSLKMFYMCVSVESNLCDDLV
jgi:hypothetical protein